jgi:hypothetical protein
MKKIITSVAIIFLSVAFAQIIRAQDEFKLVVVSNISRLDSFFKNDTVIKRTFASKRYLKPKQETMEIRYHVYRASKDTVMEVRFYEVNNAGENVCNHQGIVIYRIDGQWCADSNYCIYFQHFVPDVLNRAIGLL